MVKIKIGDSEVTIEEGRVSASPSDLAALLRDHLTTYPAPGPADPDPDRLQAERLIADLGGEILSADAPPEYDAAVIY